MRRWALRAFRLLPPRVRRSLVRVWAPSYTVGAICVVTHGAETLLVRHTYRRDWGAPGGLLDRGELPERAAVREVGEEVGLAVGLIAGPLPVVWPVYRRVDLVYRSVLDEGVDPGDARPTSVEIVECRWFRVDELPKLQPDTEEALRLLGIGAPITD
jgi:8-oxo-dGTP pyrophosphatase MutT (NUDIX family)